MKYFIAAQAYKGNTPVAEPRIEEVDTAGQFKEIMDLAAIALSNFNRPGKPLILQTREAYEAFWNYYLDDPTETVVVLHIEEKLIQ